MHTYTYFLTYLLTYLLTLWCRVFLEKLTGLQLVKKFPTFHGTRRFITALTSVRHLSLSWTSPIQSIYPHPTSWIHPNIIHPSTPRSFQWSPSLRFLQQDPIHPPLLAHRRQVFNNLKFTLQHLKRSYMFRSYDHPQGAYFVLC